MTRLSIQTENENETLALGRRLGELCQSGDLFLLSGELGTGKTCLVRGIAHGLGVNEVPLSPSFVLIREYMGRLNLYHMDFYRMEQPEEIVDLGVEDYLNADGVCAIEWAERAADLLPDECLRITLSYMPTREQSRGALLEATGCRHTRLLTTLAHSPEAARKWN
ncbi:MAG: tRNA (adenosine(37)-N6)-threonylcarbamoyltransferase complex ATPase subunit type 1 TsaE [Chloroflexota bacterium]